MWGIIIKNLNINLNNKLEYLIIKNPLDLQIERKDIFYRESYSEIIDYIKFLLSYEAVSSETKIKKIKGSILIDAPYGSDILGYIKLIAKTFTLKFVKLNFPEIRKSPNDFILNFPNIFDNLAKIYREAMNTWIKLIQLNEFYAIYFFRQLPDWIRTIYYEKHPEKQYLSKVPLSRFMEEPLRIWESSNPELTEAFKILSKYGRNMPRPLYNKVRKIMEKYGVWKSRENWTKEQWSEYWKQRALKLNEVDEQDFDRLPLLQKELKIVQKTYPLRTITPPFKKPRIGMITPFF